MTTTPTTATIPTPDLIDAARASVAIETRVHTLEISDHNGDIELVPIAIMPSTGGGYRIDVLRDAINESERRASGPRRRAAGVELGSLADLIAYVNRYKTPDVVAFAPLSPPGVTAIFDYHPATALQAGQPLKALPAAAWCQDRATYKCPLSRQWKTWTEAEPKVFSQVAFGDFIEANELDLTTKEGFAPALKMIEVARNLVINQSGTYQRKVDPTTGQYTHVAKDEHGENSTKIPPKFALAIPVFEGDETPYLVEARVRFTMIEGKTPAFAFVLMNKEKVLEDALAELRKRVADGCGIPVFVGTPPAPAR